MYRLKKHHDLETSLALVCDKCHQQLLWASSEQPKDFAEQLKELASLYDKKVVNEDAYHDLLRLFISMYIANTVSTRVTCDLDRALREKLSPHRLLEALV